MIGVKGTGWSLAIWWPGRVVLLKSPRYPALFSERNRLNMRVIPLGFGWRITSRKIP